MESKLPRRSDAVPGRATRSATGVVRHTGHDLDSLTYQTVSLRAAARSSDEWATVQLGYKPPTGSTGRLLRQPVRVRGRLTTPTGNFRFATAVAAFGLVLRASEYRGTAMLDQVLALARGAEGVDPEGERAEFVRLVESARTLNLAPEEASAVWRAASTTDNRSGTRP